jgi:hypothetical protein
MFFKVAFPAVGRSGSIRELGVPGRSALRSTTMLSGLVGCTFLIASAAWAADMPIKAPAYTDQADPAVSAFNTKYEGYGGSVANRSIYGAAGSFAVPLGGQFGLQIDGNGGSLDGSSFMAGGGHLFWRDPSRALLGFYGASTYWDRFGGVNVNYVGGEAEYYLGPLTIQGVAGVEFGNTATQVSTTSVAAAPPLLGLTTSSVEAFAIKTRFFDQINFKYYVNNDLSAYVGHRYLGGKNALALGTEAALPLGGGVMGSAFVEGRIGESDNHGIWGGLKLYFGPTDKPLIARSRRDDPFNWTFDTPFSLFGNHTGSSTSTPTCPGVIINGRCEVGGPPI